jgi:hypothetical protein
MASIKKQQNNWNEITDFVIPLHRYHYMVRTILESIYNFYSPKNIFIITPECYCEIININKVNWNVKNIIVIPEETFFMRNYNLHYNDINNYFTKKIDEKNREFGWWYQQIIKLGAFKQILNLSDPYVVWDSDLIPLIKWDIYPTEGSKNFKFAILQENARAEWVTEQYKYSLLELTDLPLIDPEVGTFVPHHYVFYHNVLNDLLDKIEYKMDMNWIKSIINNSKTFYRFSEYRMVSSFMYKYYPSLLNYHSFEKFGNFGKRIRENSKFLSEINNFLNKEKINVIFGISYLDFTKFAKEKYNNLPSYLQIEHI